MTVADTELLDLSIGQISGPGPKELQHILTHGLTPPYNAYAAPVGLPGARIATARALALQSGPASVVMTTGASGAFLAFLLVSRETRPRPRITLPDPCYPAFLNTCRRLGIAIDTYRIDGPYIDLDSFTTAATENTIGAVIISPGNPTGVVASETDVLAAEHVAAALDIPLVLDESYADLVDPSVHQPQLAMLHERSVRLRSFSKCFALSGHRIGALVASPRMADTFAQAHFGALMSAPTVSQVLAATCLGASVRDAFLASTRARLSERHRVLREAVSNVHGLEVDDTDVGVFAWVRLPVDGRTMAQRLGRQGVLVVPGVAFGDSCHDRVRVLADIPEPAVERLADALHRVLDDG